MRPKNFPVNNRESLFGLKGWFSRHQKHVVVQQPETAWVELRVATRGKKVLIVDDDAVIRKALSLKLESDGYTVITASDGPQAITAARKEKPDLIILDIGFPPDIGGVAWDGFLVINWLRRREGAGDIPVIVMSGTSAGLAEKALAHGAYSFLLKPIDSNALLGVVAKAISEERSRKQKVLPADIVVDKRLIVPELPATGTKENPGDSLRLWSC